MSTRDPSAENTAPLGRRQARLASARRRRRTTVFAVVSALALVAVFGVVVLPLLLRSGQRTATTAAASNEPRGSQAQPVEARRTLLLVRYEEPGGPAVGVTLLSAAGPDSQAVVVFLPTGLLVDVPGVGFDRLAQAQRYGGTDLVRRSVAEALGIEVTHVAGLLDDALPELLGAAGPLTIDVGSEVLIGAGQVAFEAGEQELDGNRLAQYWTFDAPDEPALADFPRQQEVLESLFLRLAEDPAQMDRLLGVGQPLLDTDATEDDLRALVASLVSALEEDRLAFRLLPVEPVGPTAAGGEGSYNLSATAAEEIGALLALGPPVDDGQTRVQVLDGVGEPGVTQAVDQALGDGDFRIVQTDNAPSEVDRTEIIVYDDSDESRARAEAVREALGTGTITTSSRPQSVIDVTVVVGADFPVASTTTTEPPS